MTVAELRQVLSNYPDNFSVETVDSVDGYEVGRVELDEVNVCVTLLPEE